METPFLFWRFFALLTGRGWVAAVYPAGGYPSPQRTWTDCTAQAAAQAVPNARQTMQDRLRRVDRDVVVPYAAYTDYMQDRLRRVDRDGGR